MKKSIAIGIILLFIGAAVTPCINSKVVKTSDDNKTIRSKITSQPVSILFKRISHIFKRMDLIKHPFLFVFVYLLASFRGVRGALLFAISISYPSFPGYPTIKHPLLFLRGSWLIITVAYWLQFWNSVSDSEGWNWPPLAIG